MVEQGINTARVLGLIPRLAHLAEQGKTNAKVSGFCFLSSSTGGSFPQEASHANDVCAHSILTHQHLDTVEHDL